MNVVILKILTVKHGACMSQLASMKNLQSLNAAYYRLKLMEVVVGLCHIMMKSSTIKTKSLVEKVCMNYGWLE